MSPANKTGPILENIPDELKELNQFVVWRNEERDGELTKVPYQPAAPERRAKSNDPATWSALAIAHDLFWSGQWDGIGFVFSPDDPYCGIDFDGCLVDGDVAEWAWEWIADLLSAGAYGEISPSGKGIKFFCRARLPGAGGKRTIGEGQHTGIEIYDRSRYFAVTGEKWSANDSRIGDAQAIVDRLYAWVKELKNPIHLNGQAETQKRESSAAAPDVEKRAREYARTIDPAISGQNGHSKTFYAACKIGPGFDLPRDLALRIIAEEYNPRCQPPWSEHDLEHKIDSAYATEAKRGWLLQNKPTANQPDQWQRPAPSPDDQHLDYSALSDEELGIVPLCGVRERPIEWYWEYRVARGEMTLTAGEGGLGKSQVLLALAAASSNGSSLPDGSGPAPIGRTVILSAEDSPETTIKPRLLALDADISRITLLKASVTIRKPGKEPHVHPYSLRDLAIWRAVFDRLRDTMLFIVDPLPSYLGRGVNDQRSNEIREILEPFIDEIVRPRHIGMLANTHLNKCIDARTPIHRILGSVAYGNLARNVHFIVRDPEAPERRFIKQAKCNNAPDDLAAIAFRIEKRIIPSEDGDIEAAIPVFDSELISVDLAHVMNAEKPRRGPQRSQQSVRLIHWLFDYLASEGRPVQAGPLYDTAAAAFKNDRPNPLGEKGDDGKWSNGRILLRAADRVEELEPPRNGKRVERFQDTTNHRWYWQLIDKGTAF
jgi:hypothetical protein